MINGFGDRFRRLREEQHWSQEEVAEFLGLKTATIKQYENDSCQPATQTLIKIADVFCTTMDYLLGLNENSSVSLAGLTDDEVILLENFNKAIIDKLKN